MAERTVTVAQRAQVVAFANRHGPLAAARWFGLPKGTVGAWQYRARARERRRRQAQAEIDRERAQEPAATPEVSEAELARRMAAGLCLRCAGAGRMIVPPVLRGPLVIRPARHLTCPDCGGPVRHLEVVEQPRDAWVQGMATAGDLGAGWSPDEWARIRAGELDPDGYRITGRPDA
jgi:hypothetical protein